MPADNSWQGLASYFATRRRPGLPLIRLICLHIMKPPRRLALAICKSPPFNGLAESSEESKAAYLGREIEARYLFLDSTSSQQPTHRLMVGLLLARVSRSRMGLTSIKTQMGTLSRC